MWSLDTAGITLFLLSCTIVKFSYEKKNYEWLPLRPLPQFCSLFKVYFLTKENLKA